LTLWGQADLGRGHLEAAVQFFEDAIARAERGGWSVVEGFARKSLALEQLAAKETTAALVEVDRAARLLEGHPLGTAHVDRARGMILSARGHNAEAEHDLLAAAKAFGSFPAELAWTWTQIARNRRARIHEAAIAASLADHLRLIVSAYRDALAAAEGAFDHR